MPTILVSSATDVQGTVGDDVFKNAVDYLWMIDGKHVLRGDTGNDAYYVTSDSIVVERPGEGYDTIVSATSFKLPDNVEALFVWGQSAAVGNDLDNDLFGGSPATFMNGGRGNDRLTGGGGADTFQFDAQSGHDTILDWNGADHIRLAGYNQFSDFQDVKAALTQVGSNVVLTLDAHDSITINNTTISQFKADNFQYVVELSDYKLSTSFFDDFNSFSVYQPDKGLNGHWDLWGSGSNAVTAHTLQNNGEKQLYVDPSFAGRGGTALGLNPYSIEDGALVITASPIAAANRSALYDYQFQSGAITTTGTFAQTYGYFEARMMLPAAQGSWPAFWLMREDGQWPPELDIMEAWNDTTAVQTLHTAEKGSHTMTSSSTWLPDGDTAYHNYGLLWTPDKLVWTLDGVEVFSKPTPADMHAPMYMILNLAVSGAVNDPNFNEQLKIDYVRAYAFDELPGAARSVDMGAVAGMPDGFNAAYYKAHNPDVVAAGIDPQYHYELNGKQEGRLPYEGATALKMPVDIYMGKIDTMPDGFNPDYYAKANPDVVRAGMDLLRHYTDFGKAEGRLPYDPADVLAKDETVSLGARTDMAYGFNYVYYALHNPDVVAAKISLLEHYITFGRAEGRLAYDPDAAPSSPVDNGHLPTTPVVIETPIPAPVADIPAAPAPVSTHPVTPPPVVTPPVTIPTVTPPPATTPPVTTSPVVTPPVGTTPATAAPGGAASTPHAYWGAADAAHDGFNLEYYKSHNPDVVAAGMDPLQHYLQFGKAEGRLPYDPTDTSTPASWGKVAGIVDGFNAEYYAAHNPDVVLAHIDPLTHYLEHGRAEGRLAYDQAAPAMPAPAAAAADSKAIAFDAAYYALHNPDVMIAGIDPLTHYQLHGKSEGRLAFDDGSGLNTQTGGAGNDILIAPDTPTFRVMTGGAGADAFRFTLNMGWETVTDFDAAHDKLDASALFQAYGAPTISDLGYTSGSIAHFAGGEAVILLGVSAAQAQLVLLG